MNAESDEIDIFQFHRTRDKLQAENFTMGLIFDTESHEQTVIRERKGHFLGVKSEIYH